MDAIARMDAGDLADLFREVEKRRGDITAEIIEKDFWVCWTLKHVFGLGPAPAQLIFKGGTSLSKVYGVIDRFSEDIDLSLSREDLGFKGEFDPARAASGKKRRALLECLVARCREAIELEFLPGLRERFTGTLGREGAAPRPWSLRLDAHDPQTVLFAYPPGLPQREAAFAYVRPVVRLELGARSDHWPAEERAIRPYAADVLPELFSEPACRVRTLSAERTFWEKATLLHAEYHRPAGKMPGERLSRHYYDLAKLYRSEIGRRALGDRGLLTAVVAHKQLFFASAWASYQTASPGGFRLVPPRERLAALEADYRVTCEQIIFGESYSFDELMAVVREIEAAING